jgi:ABC-type Fe3+ transport system permease subunit
MLYSLPVMPRRPSMSALAATVMWLLIGICCLAPLLWLADELFTANNWRQMYWDSFRWKVFLRTLLYNGSAAGVAVLMALPAAVVVGRGRGWWSRILTSLLPLSMALPSIAYSYGWLHAILLVWREPVPASAADVLRCIWTLAAWLWGLPALVIGLSLRNLDSRLQLAALLDGALWRITGRLLLKPIIASFALTGALAMQEFGVYERGGIVVLSTEVRTVFETGASSSDNPAAVAGAPSGSGVSATDGFASAQSRRAAAAVATGLPMLLLAIACAGGAMLALRRDSAAELLEAGTFPPCLEAGWKSKAVTTLLLLITLAVPIAAMVLCIRPSRWATDAQGHGPLVRIWLAVGPKVMGSLYYGLLAGAAGLVLALAATAGRLRGALAIALLSFAVGGELLAIATIRVFNHDSDLMQGIYNGPAIMVIAYVGRFGWIALLAGAVTLGGPWRGLRESAAVDGASLGQMLMRIVWPLAWPVLVAGAVLVLILSITEVSTAVLLSPQKPQILIVTMMQWVHQIRTDDMLEATLLLVGIVTLLAAGTAVLLAFGGRAMRAISSFSRRSALPVLLAAIVILPAGCRDPTRPSAIWMETGLAQGQLVYPRGIVFSRPGNCFFVVDRSARIQRVELDGRASAMWCTPEDGNGKPVGISVGPDGDVYVPDTHYARVLVYSPDGQLKRQWGTYGTGTGQFVFPTDVAFDSTGHIYVSEYGENDRIQVFDPVSLEVIRAIGSPGMAPGQFSRPQSMLIDGDTLYVADACNHRLQAFSLDGKLLRVMGSCGSELGQFRYPHGLDMDAAGRLVVCEFGNNRIQWIDKTTGQGLKTWGAPGREPGELAYPWAVAVDKSDRVVVVDSGNNRLQVTGY